MKRTLLVILLLVLALAIGLTSFVSGYFYRAYEFTPDAEMGDYTLTNILITANNKRFLANFDSSELKETIDLELSRHLFQLRKFSTFENNEKLKEVRLQILNVAHCYWSESPPFYPESFGGDGFWVEEFWENHNANLELLSNAHQEWVKKGGGACP